MKSNLPRLAFTTGRSYFAARTIKIFKKEDSIARSMRSQAKHDKEVRNIVNRMKKQVYEVKADVSGFGKPDTFGCYRPDVVAKKGGQRKIYDVETPESVDNAREKNQQSVFRNAAKRSKSTSFVHKVIG